MYVYHYQCYSRNEIIARGSGCCRTCHLIRDQAQVRVLGLQRPQRDGRLRAHLFERVQLDVVLADLMHTDIQYIQSGIFQLHPQCGMYVQKPTLCSLQKVLSCQKCMYEGR